MKSAVANDTQAYMLDQRTAPDTFAQWRRLALKHAAQFTWAASTQKLAGIYRQVLESQ